MPQNAEEILDILHARRAKAAEVQQERIEEIRRRIPEFDEINAHLRRTTDTIVAVIRAGGDVAAKIDQISRDNLDAQKMIERLLTKHGYPADYLQIHYTCTLCQDTGYYHGGYCSCFKQLSEKLAAEKLNTSIRYAQYSFESFSLERYRGDTPQAQEIYRKMERLLEECKMYVRTFSPHAKSLYFYGKTGRGKTHLSLAIASEILKKGYSVLYNSAIDFFEQAELEHYHQAENPGDTVGTMLSCDLLIIDDLGSETVSPFYRSTLYHVINTRMNRDKPTIISSNWNFDDMRAVYADRIASRIFSYYCIMEFFGYDMRFPDEQIYKDSAVKKKNAKDKKNKKDAKEYE